MTIWLYTGGRPSNSAKALAACPGFRRLITGKGLKAGDTIVNWGVGKGVPFPNAILNTATAVARAANKFATFASLAGAKLATVPWTGNLAIAKEWQAAGHTVVVRTTLTGHSGAGIIIVEPGQDIPEAPLYTRYVHKNKEFRVHASRNAVIDVQQKVRDPKQEPKTWKVRSHANGFIFQRKGIAPDAARDELCIKAIQALELDFGAVDIIQLKSGEYFILEVNTAPGLEGQTIETYQKALLDLVNAPNPAAAG